MGATRSTSGGKLCPGGASRQRPDIGTPTRRVQKDVSVVIGTPTRRVPKDASAGNASARGSASPTVPQEVGRTSALVNLWESKQKGTERAAVAGASANSLPPALLVASPARSHL